jgi:hypothetical protein
VSCVNGCKDDDAATVTQDINMPAVTITPDGGQLTCATTYIILTADTTGSNCSVTSYQWYKDSVALGGQTASTLNVTAPGTYKVEVSCVNGCKDDDAATVTQNITPPEATASSNSPVSQGATIQLTGGPDGMASYSWTGPGGFASSDQNPTRTAATTAMEGIYTLTVINSNGCSDDASTSVDVTVPVTPAGGGGGSCPTTKYLTVDWEGNNTTEPLYSNDCLAVDLLGPSFDLSHNLLLEQGTHAPTVDERTHYLIVVRELEGTEIPPVPDNTVAIVVFNITPVDAVFDQDIFLTLGLDELQLPANAQNVTMDYYDDIDGVWVPLQYETGGPSGVAELTLSAPINHFSIFGVLAELASTPTQPAHFVPGGLSIVPGA